MQWKIFLLKMHLPNFFFLISTSISPDNLFECQPVMVLIMAQCRTGNKFSPDTYIYYKALKISEWLKFAWYASEFLKVTSWDEIAVLVHNNKGIQFIKITQSRAHLIFVMGIFYDMLMLYDVLYLYFLMAFYMRNSHASVFYYCTNYKGRQFKRATVQINQINGMLYYVSKISKDCAIWN